MERLVEEGSFLVTRQSKSLALVGEHGSLFLPLNFRCWSMTNCLLIAKPNLFQTFLSLRLNVCGGRGKESTFVIYLSFRQSDIRRDEGQCRW